jgi:hypothetical protein
MSRRPRRNHTAAFKVKVALAALKGEKPLSELAEQFDSNQQLTKSALFLYVITSTMVTGFKLLASYTHRNFLKNSLSAGF